jgi:hypothetical protein
MRSRERRPSPERAEPAVGDHIHDGRADLSRRLTEALRADARAAFPGEPWHRPGPQGALPEQAPYTRSDDELAD